MQRAGGQHHGWPCVPQFPVTGPAFGSTMETQQSLNKERSSSKLLLPHHCLNAYLPHHGDHLEKLPKICNIRGSCGYRVKGGSQGVLVCSQAQS